MVRKNHSEEYTIGEPPDAIPDKPRDSEHGTVVDEVGVREKTSSKEFWKVIQKIKKDNGETELRHCYYANTGNGWNFSPAPLMLPADVLDELTERAKSNGLFE
jgi:hypothetical protein